MRLQDLAVLAFLIVLLRAQTTPASGKTRSEAKSGVKLTLLRVPRLRRSRRCGRAARAAGDDRDAFHRLRPQPAADTAYTDKVLSDAQLADLFAYVKSLPVSPSADQIPLLSRIMAGK